jgi:type I restriction enzyme R subunit
VALVASLDEEETRATREGRSEDELALFDLLKKEKLDKTTREKVKQASKSLLVAVQEQLGKLDRFWEKEQTKADVEVLVRDQVFMNLPTPPFTDDEKSAVAANVYSYIWQRAVRGDFAQAA